MLQRKQRENINLILKILNRSVAKREKNNCNDASNLII